MIQDVRLNNFLILFIIDPMIAGLLIGNELFPVMTADILGFCYVLVDQSCLHINHMTFYAI